MPGPVTTNRTLFTNGVGQFLTSAAGGSAGSHTMPTGTVAVGDRIMQVLHITPSTGAAADKTSEYTILSADHIGNTGGTGSTSKQILAIIAKGS